MTQTELIGPVLVLDDIAGAQMHLAALFLADPGTEVPPLYVGGVAHPVRPIAEFGGLGVYRARFAVAADGAAGYGWNGRLFPLACDLRGDLRIAYVSCNGMEHGDLDRPSHERNAMWQSLADEHDHGAFCLAAAGRGSGLCR